MRSIDTNSDNKISLQELEQYISRKCEGMNYNVAKRGSSFGDNTASVINEPFGENDNDNSNGNDQQEQQQNKQGQQHPFTEKSSSNASLELPKCDNNNGFNTNSQTPRGSADAGVGQEKRIAMVSRMRGLRLKFGTNILKQMVEFLDTDNDGYISKDELRMIAHY